MLEEKMSAATLPLAFSPTPNLDRGAGQRLKGIAEISAMGCSQLVSPLAQLAVRNREPHKFSFVANQANRNVSPSTTPKAKKIPVVAACEYETLREIGRGAFSVVHLSRHKETQKLVAVKTVNKSKVVQRGQISHILSERDLLHTLSAEDCPFVAHFYGWSQDPENIYFFLEYYSGGDLYDLMNRHGPLSENEARFYVSEVLVALQVLQEDLGFVYRDLKPENALLDSEGHVVLVDFGHSKKLGKGERTRSMCGTMDYVAPEVILAATRAGPPYGRAVDYYSVGVLIFEMLVGTAPFASEPLLRCKDPRARRISFPPDMDPISRDLVGQLLRLDPNERLGSVNGVEDIMQHAWFEGLDWTAVREKKVTPPHKPPSEQCIFASDMFSPNPDSDFDFPGF
eukprot:comp23533_c0_seq1/m.39606 comp23533_c0_seq1/g.39606  ORF comp23533_c0_seq1/g.39606 comp23533_c0_seq1/m.39606 type:complete len:398 (-) comp23533_c0_seq1:82-1275(-)